MIKEKFTTQSLEHLGILAGVLKKVKFIEKIDKLLPIAKEKGAKATIGERVTAMIYNALGFMDNRLYMFSSFLSHKPIKRWALTSQQRTSQTMPWADA